MKTATALTKPNSFNINDYMPTIDYDNHTVTANGGITFGNGSSKLDDFNVTSSSNEQYLVDGKKNYWLTNGLKRSGWVRVSGRTGGYGVVVGDVVVKNNIDVGGYTTGSYSECTFVVDGDLTLTGELQMRKNSVVIVTGNLTCGKLFMKDGARLYVKAVSYTHLTLPTILRV